MIRNAYDGLNPVWSFWPADPLVIRNAHYPCDGVWTVCLLLATLQAEVNSVEPSGKKKEEMSAEFEWVSW